MCFPWIRISTEAKRNWNTGRIEDMPGKSLTWLVAIVIFLCSAFRNLSWNHFKNARKWQTEEMIFFFHRYIYWRCLKALYPIKPKWCEVKSTSGKDLWEWPTKSPYSKTLTAIVWTPFTNYTDINALESFLYACEIWPKKILPEQDTFL